MSLPLSDDNASSSENLFRTPPSLRISISSAPINSSHSVAGEDVDEGVPSDSLNDEKNYIDRYGFFAHQQDDGIPIFENERCQFEGNDKSKAKHIRFGNRFYPSIWDASWKIYRDMLVPNPGSADENK